MKRLQPSSVLTIWRKKDKELSTSSRYRRMVSVFHVISRVLTCAYFLSISFSGTIVRYFIRLNIGQVTFVGLRVFLTLKLKRDASKFCMPYVVVHVLCSPPCAAHAAVRF